MIDQVTKAQSAWVREQLRAGITPEGFNDGLLDNSPDGWHHVNFAGIKGYEEDRTTPSLERCAVIKRMYRFDVPIDEGSWRSGHNGRHRTLYDDTSRLTELVTSLRSCNEELISIVATADGEQCEALLFRKPAVDYLISSIKFNYSFQETLADLFDLLYIPASFEVTNIEFI